MKDEKYNCTCNPDRHYPPVLCDKHNSKTAYATTGQPCEIHQCRNCMAVWAPNSINKALADKLREVRKDYAKIRWWIINKDEFCVYLDTKIRELEK